MRGSDLEPLVGFHGVIKNPSLQEAGVWSIALKQCYSTALTMSSMTFFASPKTIMVLSR